MTKDVTSATDDALLEPRQHQLCYFHGRCEEVNPDALVGQATEFEPGIFHVRLDDRSNDAFWLEFTLILSVDRKESDRTL